MPLPTGQETKPSSDQASVTEFADNAQEKCELSPLHPSEPAACCIIAPAFEDQVERRLQLLPSKSNPHPSTEESKGWKYQDQQIPSDTAQLGQVTSPGLSNAEM